jgi:hypothetical protein
VRPAAPPAGLAPIALHVIDASEREAYVARTVAIRAASPSLASETCATSPGLEAALGGECATKVEAYYFAHGSFGHDPGDGE